MADAFARFRRAHYTDTSGNKMRASLFGSKPVSDAADDGYSSRVSNDNYEVIAVAIHSAGYGYHAGDVLTVAGGTGTSATIGVAAVDGSGAITQAVVIDRGNYTVAPATPNAATGGYSGSGGASIDLSIGAFRDLFLGGSGGGGQAVKVQEDMGDYLVCRSWDWTTLGTVDINVAKPPEFRGSGVVVVAGARSASAPYVAGDVLIALTVDHTGVMVEVDSVETEITLIDANVCGRAVGTEFHYRDFANGCHEYKTYIPMTPPEFVA